MWRRQDAGGEGRTRTVHKISSTCKPNISIFVYAMRKANASSNESIFIDDSMKNIQSAESLGINTHHYENHDKLIRFLEEYA